jgi:1-acyl-sn-glycerol-3-phosphate acyltransferase
MSLGHLRSLLFTIPVAMAATAIMITFAVVTSLFIPSPDWQQRLYRAWGRIVFFIVGIRYRVRGTENLDPDGNYVVVSNHLSLMDTPLLMQALPIPFKFLAKRELLKVPFIGWYLQRAGHLTVSRGNLRSSIESMNECARLVRDRHLSVLIFAEGTRGTGELQPFKDGAAYLSIQSGVPAAPIAIVGTEKILPSKSSYFRSGEVELRIGKPIAVDGLTLKQRGELTASLQQRVQDLLSGQN